jgi:hypothetical protein
MSSGVFAIASTAVPMSGTVTIVSLSIAIWCVPGLTSLFMYPP